MEKQEFQIGDIIYCLDEDFRKFEDIVVGIRLEANCNLLKRLELPNISDLTNLTLEDNPNLSELNSSHSSGLLFNNLNLALLTGLKKLNLEQTQATIGEGVEQDGTIKLKLPYIKGTVENATWEGLTYLNATKSGLKTIGYG